MDIVTRFEAHRKYPILPETREKLKVWREALDKWGKLTIAESAAWIAASLDILEENDRRCEIEGMPIVESTYISEETMRIEKDRKE